jgi:hypothetical protein
MVFLLSHSVWLMPELRFTITHPMRTNKSAASTAPLSVASDKIEEVRAARA